MLPHFLRDERLVVSRRSSCVLPAWGSFSFVEFVASCSGMPWFSFCKLWHLISMFGNKFYRMISLSYLAETQVPQNLESQCSRAANVRRKSVNSDPCDNTHFVFFFVRRSTAQEHFSWRPVLTQPLPDLHLGFFMFCSFFGSWPPSGCQCCVFFIFFMKKFQKVPTGRSENRFMSPRRVAWTMPVGTKPCKARPVFSGHVCTRPCQKRNTGKNGHQRESSSWSEGYKMKTIHTTRPKAYTTGIVFDLYPSGHGFESRW